MITLCHCQFETDCRPFRIVGFNAHDLVQAATMTPYDFNMKGGVHGLSC